MSRIQQIFRDHAPEYLERFGGRIPEAHRRVMAAITECRSGARGQHLFLCPDCAHPHVANSSRGNRHCPVRQRQKAAQWVYRQQQRRRLPCAYDGTTVTFKYQKVGAARWRRRTVSALEFMRRFLQHTLPAGFMKVRHYGFCSPNFALPVQKIRELICVLYELLRHQPLKLPPPKAPKPLRCPRCRALMRWVRFFPALSGPKASPAHVT